MILMKNNILIFMLVGALIYMFSVTSCAPDYQTEFNVESLVVPDKGLTPIFLPIGGGDKVIEVVTNVPFANWTASSNAEWCVVKKEDGKVTVSAGNNDLFLTRIARVTISYGHQAYSINVTQTGKEPQLLVEGQRKGVVKSVSASPAEITVRVSSNMNVDYISIPDTANWVHLVSNIADGSDRILKFKTDMSKSETPRFSTILIQSSDNPDYMSSFIVKQEAIKLQHSLIALTESMLSSNAQEPNEGPIRNLLDNNAGTFFHSAWSYSISVAHYLQVALPEPVSIFKFWYQNRNNSNGKPTDVTISVSNDGQNWRVLIPHLTGLPTGASSTYESKPIFADEPFSYFRFTVNKTNGGTAPTYFNMAELKMYKSILIP